MLEDAGTDGKNRSNATIPRIRARTWILCIAIFIYLAALIILLFLYHGMAASVESMFQPIAADNSISAGNQHDGMARSSNNGNPAEEEDIEERTSLRLKEDVVSVLFLGIDTKKLEQQEEYNLSPHQADVLLLLAIDTKANSLKAISIPRDVTTDVQVFDVAFEYCKTEPLPLAVQYGYGNGGANSAQLTMEAVSKLMNGVPINRYVVMDLNGIKRAVNAVGGVEVTILDDFSAVDKSMKQGSTMKLNGTRAELYIRARESMPDSLNASRMRRQQQFLLAFIQTVKSRVQEDPTFILTLYSKMKKSLLTNLELDELLFLAKTGLSMKLSDGSFVELPVDDTSTVEKTTVLPKKQEIEELVNEIYYEQVS